MAAYCRSFQFWVWAILMFSTSCKELQMTYNIITYVGTFVSNVFSMDTYVSQYYVSSTSNLFHKFDSNHATSKGSICMAMAGNSSRASQRPWWMSDYCRSFQFWVWAILMFSTSCKELQMTYNIITYVGTFVSNVFSMDTYVSQYYVSSTSNLFHKFDSNHATSKGSICMARAGNSSRASQGPWWMSLQRNCVKTLQVLIRPACHLFNRVGTTWYTDASQPMS